MRIKFLFFIKKISITFLLIFCFCNLVWTGSASAISENILKQKKELIEELAQKKENAKLNPNDPEAHFELAMAFAYTGYLEEGWAELLKVYELDKDYAQKVIQRYTQIVEKEPDNWKARFRLAFGYYFDGYLNKEKEWEQKEKAIEQFLKIIEKYPENVWAYNYMGYIFAEKGQLQKAINIWKKSISLDPTIPATHFVLGHAYLKTGKYVEGVSEITLALRLKALGK